MSEELCEESMGRIHYSAFVRDMYVCMRSCDARDTDRELVAIAIVILGWLQQAYVLLLPAAVPSASLAICSARSGAWSRAYGFSMTSIALSHV